MKKYWLVLLLSILLGNFELAAEGLQCGPGGVIIGNKDNTAARLGKAGINYFISSSTYTSATTSSTSGCDGFFAYHQAERHLLIANNYEKLRNEAARGISAETSHISALATVYGCADLPLFANTLHTNYTQLFHNPSLAPQSSTHFLNAIESMIQKHPNLEHSCKLS